MSTTTSHASHESDGDASNLSRNEEQAGSRDERAGNSVAEGAGGSAMAEACIEGQQIKEVFVDGFSYASLNLSEIGSPYDCTKDAYDCAKDEEQSCCEKLVEEVMVFEINCKEFSEIYCCDVSSEKQQQQGKESVDSFVEEIASSRQFCMSCDAANLLHLQSGQEVVVNRKEDRPCATPEILELIDNHETGTMVAICSHNTGKNYVNCRADFPVDIFAKNVPGDMFDEQQGTQTTVTDRTNKLSQDHFVEDKGKQIIGISDGTHDLNTDIKMPRLPLDSVSEKKCSTVATSNASFDHTDSGKEDADVKELPDMAEALDTTSLLCAFTENHQVIREDIGIPSADDNIHDVAVGEISAIQRTEVEPEDSFSLQGGLRRLPLVRRSQPLWWNLCGVLDVFTGCED